MPSKTKKQRRFMGMVKAFKEGKSKSASPEVKKAAMSMTSKQASDMAKQLPKKSRRRLPEKKTDTTGPLPEWVIPKKMRKKPTAKDALTTKSRKRRRGAIVRSAA